jgi:hypothetical protein
VILADFKQDVGCHDDEYRVLRLGFDWDVRGKCVAWCTHWRCGTLMNMYGGHVLDFSYEGID